MSNRTKPLQEVYKENKKDEYLEGLLNVEKATFTVAVFLTTGGMTKECKEFVNSGRPHRQEKEREVLRCGKTCEDKNKLRNVKNHTHCSTRVQREKNGQQI